MNLRNKMVLAFFTFVIVPLFIVGIITYTQSQNIIERNFNEQTELTIRSVGKNVSFIIREVNQFSEYWRSSDRLNSIFDQPEGNWKYQDSIVKNAQVLVAAYMSYTPIYQVTLYNLQGDAISTGKDSQAAVSKGDLWKIKQLPIFPEVTRLNGTPKWIGPYEYPEISEDRSMYQTIRVLIDPATMNVRGYLHLRLNMTDLNETFKSFLYNQPEGSRFLIVNKSGLVLQDSENKLAGSKISDYVDHQLKLDEEYDSSKLMFDNVESMVATYKLDLQHEGVTDWSLIYVSPWNSLSGKTMSVLKSVAFVIAFCLVCALLFNVLFVNRYIRFILRFVSSMKRVELGDLSVRLPMVDKKEMGVLSRGFNSLVGRITHLLDEVKLEQQRKNKAELMLLEAQIKPHFLFNTLESINAMAIQNEGKKVSQLVYRLGSMLRMFEHDEEISIGLELDYLRNYLEIQSFRFENLFDYQIDLPSRLEKCCILKLSLQPLVENSIQHGFEHMENGGLVRVRVEEQDNKLVVWVEDNGSGIGDRVLERLHYKASPTNLYKQPDGAERIGLGLMNVAERLRIHYGMEYGIMICSEPHQGTIIKCVVPKYTVTG